MQTTHAPNHTHPLTDAAREAIRKRVQEERVVCGCSVRFSVVRQSLSSELNLDHCIGPLQEIRARERELAENAADIADRSAR